MKFLINCFSSFFFDLNDAIYNKDESLFDHLINEKRANTLTRDGFSPLQISLNKKNYKMSYKLLENKANVDHQFYDSDKSKKISLLQRRIFLKDLSQAKLLIYYGASLSGTKIHDKQMETELKESAETYKNKIAPYVDQENRDAYEHSCQIWQEISEKEQETTLKQCYHLKAQSYNDKLNQLQLNEDKRLLINEVKHKNL
jgi:hypothetical protein